METPKKIGSYQIETVLRKELLSTSYLALHPTTQDSILIKVLDKQYLTQPNLIATFVNEAKILAMTNHPNIIKFYEQGEWQEFPYIVTEYVEGITLSELISETPPSLRKALQIIFAISSALAHMHALGIVHGELSPENILVTPAEEIKIVNFGIAKLYTLQSKVEGTSSAQSPEILTHSARDVYKSPEVRANPMAISYASDVYSLGVIAYELILGVKCGKEVFFFLLPAPLQPLIFKAMQPKPEDRFSDIIDFAQGILHYQESASLPVSMQSQPQSLSQQQPMSNVDFLDAGFGEIKRVQTAMLESPLLNWKNIEFGMINHYGMTITSLYYDFLTTSDGSYAIFIGEPVNKGIKGLIGIAILRGMVRALFQVTSDIEQLFTNINDSLADDHLEEIFNLSCLILSEDRNTFSFVSAGDTSLFYLPANAQVAKKIEGSHASLGLDIYTGFKMVEHLWHPKDRLLLKSFAVSSATQSTTTELQEEMMLKALVDNAKKTAQEQVEVIFSTQKPVQKNRVIDRALLLMLILRQEST